MISGCILLFEKIGADDPKIVVRNMGKRRPALDVAERVDATSRGFEAVVHLDEPAVVRLDSSRHKVQGIGIRHSPCREQQMRTHQSHRRCVSLLLDVQPNVPVRLGNPSHFGIQQDLNPVLLKNLGDFFRDVWIFPGEQLSAQLNNRHAAAKTPEELSKLRPNVAATQNQQVIGNHVQFHDGRVVESWNVVQAIQFGPCRAGTRIDKDIFGGERTLRAIVGENFNRLWTSRRTSKPGLAENQFEVCRLFDARLTAIAKFVDNIAFALANYSKIDTDISRPGVHSIISSAPREIGDSAACHHRLRGSAPLVNARPAHMFPLNQSSVHSGCG